MGEKAERLYILSSEQSPLHSLKSTEFILHLIDGSIRVLSFHLLVVVHQCNNKDMKLIIPPITVGKKQRRVLYFLHTNRDRLLGSRLRFSNAKFIESSVLNY